MVIDRVRTAIYGWEPHETITSREELVAFHDEVGLGSRLRRAGVHPVVFGVLFLALVVVPGAVLAFVYGVEHPLLTVPMLAVLSCNAVINLVAVFFVDRRYPAVLERIQPAFDVEPERYYGFTGRMLEVLYQYSMYAPITAGPHGRRARPWYVVLVSGFYVFWLVVLALLVPPTLPAPVEAQALFVAYSLVVVAWATTTLTTAVTFIGVTCLYLSVRASQFPIRLKIMRRYASYGLEPYGSFLFHTMFFGLAAVAVAGLAGLATGNPLLLLFAVLGTPLVVVWFIGSQYGIHLAIVSTKLRRLKVLDENYTEELDQVFIESTPEPDLKTIQDSNSFIEVKNEIESLPNWPTSMKTLYQVVTTIVLSNVPSLIALVT